LRLLGRAGDSCPSVGGQRRVGCGWRVGDGGPGDGRPRPDEGQGKVSMEEIRQLAETGLPVFDILRDKLGLTAEQIQDIGNQGVSSDKAISALLQGFDERFGGAMDAQSKTALGLLSTLKDNASFFLREI